MGRGRRGRRRTPQGMETVVMRTLARKTQRRANKTVVDVSLVAAEAADQETVAETETHPMVAAALRARMVAEGVGPAEDGATRTIDHPLRDAARKREKR